ncbi:sporulation protein YqfC [Melghiribacillus thermohalophilus]|uniref:Sporulation protein YqfC n=1 Tax=Melghiribacillus thermohalophilus TaxID=1324956 RepID=A0A4R3NHR2_9BACI|nr:sporulation protein YqfC [Melghiribacillus thermohalophilus]TCT27018.1 sporulation protein YqfC [Melghiribacillus thermohalophilus]
MAKWQRRMKQWLINQFDMPEDVMHEFPRITTIGQIHAYIENHRGLVTFSDHEILLKMTGGYVKVTGEKFVLKMMLPEEILVEGHIHSVQFIEK